MVVSLNFKVTGEVMAEKDKKPKDKIKAKDRIHRKKWKALKALGYKPPKDWAENKKRLQEAHHG